MAAEFFDSSDVLPSSRDLLTLLSKNFKATSLSLNKYSDNRAPLSLTQSYLAKKGLQIKIFDERKSSGDSDDRHSKSKRDSTSLKLNCTTTILCVNASNYSKKEEKHPIKEKHSEKYQKASIKDSVKCESSSFCKSFAKKESAELSKDHSTSKRHSKRRKNDLKHHKNSINCFNIYSSKESCSTQNNYKEKIEAKDCKLSNLSSKDYFVESSVRLLSDHKLKSESKDYKSKTEDHHRRHKSHRHKEDPLAKKEDSLYKGKVISFNSKSKSSSDPISILKDKKEKLKTFLKPESSNAIKESDKTVPPTEDKNEECKLSSAGKPQSIKSKKKYSFEEILAQASNKLFALSKSKHKKKGEYKFSSDNTETSLKDNKTSSNSKYEKGQHNKSKKISNSKHRYKKDYKNGHYSIPERNSNDNLHNSKNKLMESVKNSPTDTANLKVKFFSKKSTKKVKGNHSKQKSIRVQPIVMLKPLETELDKPSIKKLNSKGTIKVCQSGSRTKSSSFQQNKGSNHSSENDHKKGNHSSSMDSTKESSSCGDKRHKRSEDILEKKKTKSLNNNCSNSVESDLKPSMVVDSKTNTDPICNEKRKLSNPKSETDVDSLSAAHIVLSNMRRLHQESDEEFLDRLSSGMPSSTDRAQNIVGEQDKVDLVHSAARNAPVDNNDARCSEPLNEIEIPQPKGSDYVNHSGELKQSHSCAFGEKNKVSETYEDTSVPKLVLYLTGAGKDKHYKCSSALKESANDNAEWNLKKRRLKIKEIIQHPKCEKSDSISDLYSTSNEKCSKLKEHDPKYRELKTKSPANIQTSHEPAKTAHRSEAISSTENSKSKMDVHESIEDSNSLKNVLEKVFDKVLDPNSPGNGRKKVKPEVDLSSNLNDNLSLSGDLQASLSTEAHGIEKPLTDKTYNYYKKKFFNQLNMSEKNHTETESSPDLGLRVRYRKSIGFYDETVPLFVHEDDQNYSKTNEECPKDPKLSELKQSDEVEEASDSTLEDDDIPKLKILTDEKDSQPGSPAETSKMSQPKNENSTKRDSFYNSFINHVFSETKLENYATEGTQENTRSSKETKENSMESQVNKDEVTVSRRRSLSLDSSLSSKQTPPDSFNLVTQKDRSLSHGKLDSQNKTECEKVSDSSSPNASAEFSKIMSCYATSQTKSTKKNPYPLIKFTGESKDPAQKVNDKIQESSDDVSDSPISCLIEKDRYTIFNDSADESLPAKRAPSENQSEFQAKDKVYKLNESSEMLLSDAKKKKKEKRKASSRDDETQNVVNITNKQRQVFQSRDRGRRLALEIPGFNWLEEKILNSSNTGGDSYLSKFRSPSNSLPDENHTTGKLSLKKSTTPPSSPKISACNSAAKTSRSLSLPSEAMRSNIKLLPSLITSKDFTMSSDSPNPTTISNPSSVASPLTSETAKDDNAQSPIDVSQTSPPKQDQSFTASPKTPPDHAPSSASGSKRNSLEADIDPNGLIRAKRCHLQTAVLPLIPTSKVTPLPKRKVSPPALTTVHSLSFATDNVAAVTDSATTTQISSVSSSNLLENDPNETEFSKRSPPAAVQIKPIADVESPNELEEKMQPSNNETKTTEKTSMEVQENQATKSSNSNEVPVSQKLSILTEAFKNKLNSCMDISEPIPSGAKSEHFLPMEEARPFSPHKLESNVRIPTSEASPIDTDSKLNIKKCSSPEVNSSNSDDHSKITSTLSTEEESPVLISIPETIPSLESVLCNFKVNGGDSLQQNVFNMDKKPSTEPSLIAALYEELLRTRKEVEKLRKVQEQMMINAEKNNSNDSVDLSKVKLEKVEETPRPSPPLIDLSEEKESEPHTKHPPNQHQETKSDLEVDKVTRNPNMEYDLKEGEKRLIQDNTQSNKRLKPATNDQDQNVITIRYALPSNLENQTGVNQQENKDNKKLRSMLGIVNTDLDVVPVVEKISNSPSLNKDETHASHITSSNKGTAERDKNMDPNLDKPELEKLLSSSNPPNARTSLADLPSLITPAEQTLHTRRGSDPGGNPNVEKIHKIPHPQSNPTSGLLLKKTLTEKPKSNIYQHSENTSPSKINVITVPEANVMPQYNIHPSIPIIKYQKHAPCPTGQRYPYPEETRKLLPATSQMSQHSHEYMSDNVKDIPSAPTFQPKILIHSNTKKIVSLPSEMYHPPYQPRIPDSRTSAPSPMVPHILAPNIRISHPRPPNVSQSSSYHPSSNKLADIFPVPVQKHLSSGMHRSHPVAPILHPNSQSQQQQPQPPPPQPPPPHPYKTSDHVIHLNQVPQNYPVTQVPSQMYQGQPHTALSIPGNSSQQRVPSMSPQVPTSVSNLPSPHNPQIPTPRLSPNDGKKIVIYPGQHQRAYSYQSDVNPALQRVTPPHDAATLQRITPPQRIHYQQGQLESTHPHSPGNQIPISQSLLIRSQAQQISNPHSSNSKIYLPSTDRIPFPPQQRSAQQPSSIVNHAHQNLPAAKMAQMSQTHPIHPSANVAHLPRYEQQTSAGLPTSVHQSYEHKIVKMSNQAGSPNEQRYDAQSGLKPTKKCLVCRNPAQFLCSGCKMAWYCSRNCQRDHWAVHSSDCQSLR